jgi:hypothetical protein
LPQTGFTQPDLAGLDSCAFSKFKAFVFNRLQPFSTLILLTYMAVRGFVVGLTDFLTVGLRCRAASPDDQQTVSAKKQPGD